MVIAGYLTERSGFEPFKLGPAICRDVGGPDGRSLCGNRMNISFIYKVFGVN